MVDAFLKFRKTPVWKFLLKLQEFVIVLCGAVCCVIFVIEVLLRYVLTKDFLGYDEIVLLFAMWLYFIGGSYAMYKKEHISADMKSLVLKGRTLEVSHAVVSWITFVITAFLAVWGVDFFLYAMSSPAYTTVWKMPRLWSQSALMVGYILMSFYGLFYALEDTILLFRKKDGKERTEL